MFSGNESMVFKTLLSKLWNDDMAGEIDDYSFPRFNSKRSLYGTLKLAFKSMVCKRRERLVWDEL
jgi:hypothetical protein